MRQTYFLLFIISLYLHSTPIQAQKTYPDTLFSPPLNIPLFLSGTFAELRSNHFHGGIDIKTQGTTGHAVVAAADGYVSRVKIQSGGYGKTVYLTHPHGYTTVYAHLNEFTPALNKYVNEYQYSAQQYEVNLFPPKNKFAFKKGERIAYSGNTGRSGGPHLHFEIRKTAKQIPQNGLLFNFPIMDHIKPKVYNMAIYPKSFNSHVDYAFQKKIIPFGGLSDTLVIPDTIPVYGLIGLGIETYDYANNSANPCGVYSIDLEVDNELVYKSEVDEVSFGETRYINSLIDYEEKIVSSIKLQKLFLDPHNDLSIYKHVVNNGLIEFTDSVTKKAVITITDAFGNRSVVQCHMKGMPWDKKDRLKDSNVVRTFHPYRVNGYNTADFKINLPVKTLYDSIHFTYNLVPDNNPWSDIHQVHKATTPAHKYFTIGLKPKNKIPANLRSKSVICLIEEEDTSAIDTRWENNMLMGRTRNFGNYTIKTDTIPPEIVPVDFIAGQDLQGYNQISFKITDKWSDIKSYNGYIDTRWVLFEYDEKNDLIFFKMDPEKIKSGRDHDLELYVKDKMNNIATFHATFYY